MISVSQATFTPAASAHGIADVVGGAQEFKGLAQSTGSGVKIISASLMVADATLVTTTWRLHLYSVTPPSALADDAVFDIPSGDRASHLGHVDIAKLVDLGSTLYVQSDNLNKAIRPAGGRNAFGYLVNLAAVTTAAVPHTVTLYTLE